MNLLIPSIEKPSSLPLLYSLRKQFKKIIATYNSNQTNKYLLKSKYINEYVELKVPMTGWFTCNINNEFNEEEEEYIYKLFEICEAHEIKVIFPSPSDVDIYLLSKYKARFSEKNIILIVPSFDSWHSSSNKLLAVQFAKASNFPVPVTFTCKSFDEICFAANQIGYPVVLKLPFSSASSRVKFVENEDKLKENYKKLVIFDNTILVQEFIPGKIEQSLNYIISEKGEPIAEFSLQKLRYLNPSASTCIEVGTLKNELILGREIIKKLKLFNLFVAIQIKYDTNDKRYKFIEINPRFGFNSRILLNMGENLAKKILHLNMGAEVKPVAIKQGKVGISVIEDMYVLKNFIKIKRKENQPISYGDVLKSYVKSYLLKPTLDKHFTNIFRDPYACFGYYKSINKLMNEECRDFISLVNTQKKID